MTRHTEEITAALAHAMSCGRSFCGSVDIDYCATSGKLTVQGLHYHYTDSATSTTPAATTTATAAYAPALAPAAPPAPAPALAPAATTTTATATSTPAPAAALTTASYTMDDVNAELMRINTALAPDGYAKILQVLETIGGKPGATLSDIPAEKYREVIDAAQNLLAK